MTIIRTHEDLAQYMARMMTIAEAAEAWHCSTRTIYRHLPEMAPEQVQVCIYGQRQHTLTCIPRQLGATWRPNPEA